VEVRDCYKIGIVLVGERSLPPLPLPSHIGVMSEVGGDVQCLRMGGRGRIYPWWHTTLRRTQCARSNEHAPALETQAAPGQFCH
jgi:hypothetical protein